MQFLRLFSQTRREVPADLSIVGQQWLARAGYIQPLEGGLVALLPLGELALRRLEGQIRQGLMGLGAMELGLPAENSGFWLFFELARSHLRSYRQLPVFLYRSGWQDLPGVGHACGLLGGRAAWGVEVFSLTGSQNPLTGEGKEGVEEVLERFFASCRLPVESAEDLSSAREMIGRSWFYPHPAGDEEWLSCDGCGYSATPAAAQFRRPQAAEEAPAPLERVATPGCKSIAALAAFLGIPESRTAKAVFLTLNESKLVFAVVRGDREVNEMALRRVLGSDRVRPATEDEIRAVGAVPGYASPVGLNGALVVVDVEVTQSPNLTAGANEEGYHLRNVCFGRDYTADLVAEIALATEGDACPRCGGSLRAQKGFSLAESRGYSPEFAAEQGVRFLNESGKSMPPRVKMHRFYLTRTLGGLAEEHHDGNGLILPEAAAPFRVQVVVLDSKKPEVAAMARALEQTLAGMGMEALVDDRPESPGVKFNDADLIGLPLRVTVSERAIQQGGVEVKWRARHERWILRLEEVPGLLQERI
ncbi:MAG TPA: hypothetical protein DEQ80_10110 [Anaerolinea thermolimosa]|uniref:Proline--tRNA ligase n=1 Tax=Anaerolinea thermolimosa TaxID=229919 RepID=A0A3D1JHZ8_9CHLR|nr:hypothetical protein [Anaerolinea thermolimosa]